MLPQEAVKDCLSFEADTASLSHANQKAQAWPFDQTGYSGPLSPVKRVCGFDGMQLVTEY